MCFKSFTSFVSRFSPITTGIPWTDFLITNIFLDFSTFSFLDKSKCTGFPNTLKFIDTLTGKPSLALGEFSMVLSFTTVKSTGSEMKDSILVSLIDKKRKCLLSKVNEKRMVAFQFSFNNKINAKKMDGCSSV